MDAKSLKALIRGFFNVSEGRARYKTIRKRIVESAVIDGIHVCQLIAAMLIASIGLNMDSTEAVIGAMLICPLMGSVLAIAYSVASVDTGFLHESLVGLVVQVAVCLTTSTLYFVISPLANTTSALLTNSSATIWDVIIAFVGGFAGALGNSRKQEPATLLAGVAVATALMPPLCAAGYGLAARDLVFTAAGLYEFLINVVFIAFGAHIVFVLLRVPLQADVDGDGIISADEQAEALVRSHSMRRGLVIGSLLFAVPCLFFSVRVVQQAMETNGTVFEAVDAYDTEMTTYELQVLCPDIVSYRIGEEDTYDLKEHKLVRSIVATVETPKELDERKRQGIERLIRLHVEELDHVTFEVESETQASPSAKK